jgi:hypothetical protein
MELQKSFKRFIAKGLVLTNLAGLLVAAHLGYSPLFMLVVAIGLIGSMVAHEFNAD